jgi:hypothetical protein
MDTIIEIVHTIRVCSLTFITPGFVFITSLGTGRLGHNILVLIGLALVVLTFSDI